MKPALLLFPHISSYPVLLLLGFFFGWLLARKRSRFFGIQSRHLDNIALLLPIAGLFGARFFARLFYEKAPLLEALKVWDGEGLVFYGGFLFGIAAVLVYGWIRRIPLVQLADCLAPSVALGLAFGRVGCFLAGCCWGDICADHSTLAALNATTVRQVQSVPAVSGADFFMAVSFPERSSAFQQHQKLGVLEAGRERSLPVHPVQLYEAVLAALLCFLVHRRFRGQSRAGDASIALLAGYAILRFATEILRADNKLSALGLTFSQMVSVYIGAGCIALIAIRWYAQRRQAREQGAQPTVPVPEQIA